MHIVRITSGLQKNPISVKSIRGRDLNVTFPVNRSAVALWKFGAFSRDSQVRFHELCIGGRPLDQFVPLKTYFYDPDDTAHPNRALKKTCTAHLILYARRGLTVMAHADGDNRPRGRNFHKTGLQTECHSHNEVINSGKNTLRPAK